MVIKAFGTISDRYSSSAELRIGGPASLGGLLPVSKEILRA